MHSLLVHSDGEQAIDALMAYAGASQRQEELFSSLDFFSRARSGFKGLKGVENVYTQHTPFLERTLSALTKARLPEKLFPFVDPGDGSVVSAVREKPQDIIVFVVGGTTYEEGKLIAGINETLPGVRIVLGGTSVINCSMFLKVLSPLIVWCLGLTLVFRMLRWRVQSGLLRNRRRQDNDWQLECNSHAAASLQVSTCGSDQTEP
jgi:Sec1 family